ncbi:MAG: exopolysaccharide biosynthesis protein [Parvularculaceae bacterium]|nr:exopolysaccharide biosynthesis protein [Parvularculaceae bacterium]
MAPHDASAPGTPNASPLGPGGQTPIGDNEAIRHLDSHHGSASGILSRMAALAEGPRISVGALVDGLEGRAFGMLLLIFAIPALIPFLVGVHSAVGIPLAMLAWQMVLGRKEPWLPEAIRKQEIDVTAFRKMTTSVVPWIKRAEAVTKPRLDFLTNGVFERVLAAFVIFFAGIIFLPGPGTNGVPGFCVALIALGLIERDGVIASIGVILGVSYVVLAAGVIWIAVVKLWEMTNGFFGSVF